MLLISLIFALASTTASLGSLWDPHAHIYSPAVEFWSQGLQDQKHVNYYTLSGFVIAREKVITGNMSFPITPVMGRHTNTYSLFYCLSHLIKYQTNRVVILEFESAADLRAAEWTLIYFNKKWIWLQLAVSKGPNGGREKITGKELFDQLESGYGRHIWLIYEMTTEPTRPYGYEDVHWRDLQEIAFQGKLAFVSSLLLLDIVHAAETESFPEDLIKLCKYVIFQQKNGTIARDINIEGITRFIKRVGVKKVYLEVSQDIRAAILGNFN